MTSALIIDIYCTLQQLQLATMFSDQQPRFLNNRMGWCTTTYTRPCPCPNCRRDVKQVHQPFQYQPDINVCSTCFNSVQAAGSDSFKPSR